jgi:hypothetical protein
MSILWVSLQPLEVAWQHEAMLRCAEHQHWNEVERNVQCHHTHLQVRHQLILEVCPWFWSAGSVKVLVLVSVAQCWNCCPAGLAFALPAVWHGCPCGSVAVLGRGIGVPLMSWDGDPASAALLFVVVCSSKGDWVRGGVKCPGGMMGPTRGTLWVCIKIKHAVEWIYCTSTSRYIPFWE